MPNTFTQYFFKNTIGKIIFSSLITFLSNVEISYSTNYRSSNSNSENELNSKRNIEKKEFFNSKTTELYDQKDPIFQNHPSKGWQESAKAAADSWEMSLDDYLSAVKNQLKTYNEQHYTPRPITINEVIPVKKPIFIGNIKDNSIQKGPYCHIYRDTY